MGWIGVERTRNITPRESGQTSIWSFVTRELGQPLQERRQMTAVTTLTGALPDSSGAWHAIDWYAVHRNVRRLQARIVKAVQARRWGKVRALQHLLTHSFSGKALAVQTSDGQRRQADSGGGRHDLGHPGEESTCPPGTAAARLPRPPAAAHLHSEERWHESPAPLGDPHDARPGDAGALPARA